MKSVLLSAALVLGAVSVPSDVLADDPNDPEMQTAAARARDAELIRQLNRDMLAQIQAREASQRAGWQAYKDYPTRQAEYEAAMARYQQSQTAFADSRSQYEAEVAAWRRAVERCKAGEVQYCLKN